MNLSLIRSMTRSAVFELENGLCYRPAHPFTVTLNGKTVYEACQTNVFSLFSLLPGTEYTVGVQAEGESLTCTFTTEQDLELLPPDIKVFVQLVYLKNIFISSHGDSPSLFAVRDAAGFSQIIMLQFMGLMLGAGMYISAFAIFMALLCGISLFPSAERYLKDRSNHFEVHLELKSSFKLQDFVATIRKLGIRIDDIEANPAYLNSGLSVYTVSLTVDSQELKKEKKHSDIIEALRSLDYIYYNLVTSVWFY